MKQKKSIGKIVRIIEAFSDYDVECLYFIAALLFIRISEAIALHATEYNAELILNNLEGFLSDIAYSGKYLLAACIIYIIIHKFSQKIANIIIRICFAVCICVSLILVAYFSSTHIPLDNIITAYTPKELFVAIKADGIHNIIIICAIVIISIVFAVIPRAKTRISKWISLVILIIMVGCIFFPGLDKEKFRYDKEYYIVENKIAYLTNSISSGSSTIQYTDSELNGLASDFSSYFPDYQFIDHRYPFLHKYISNDVLSDYFEIGPTKPNIVIIICEGLCNEISGQNSTATSATPFLDSLAEHSLVWENCMSTSERTYGVLPSVLGALPFGEKGFMSYRRDVPDFNSLATILHDNGYENTFFYGGWYGFDGMDIFSKNNSMSMYYEDKKYETIPERNEWGLLDEYMLNQSFNAIESDNPRLDIYMTLSTHDPYDYPNADKYTEKYKDKQNQAPDKRQINEYFNEYASFMYLDDCLKDFFEKYQAQKSYKNTIFIITGDHRFIYSEKTPIINFQVPLIIWSPMLKSSKYFPAITTHRNIMPSLLAFLSKNYAINIPSNTVALNSGLDTSSNFRATTFSPLFSNNRKLKALIYNNYLITNDEIYEFDTIPGKISLKKSPSNEHLSALPKLYSDLEKYIMNNNALKK